MVSKQKVKQKYIWHDEFIDERETMLFFFSFFTEQFAIDISFRMEKYSRRNILAVCINGKSIHKNNDFIFDET